MENALNSAWHVKTLKMFAIIVIFIIVANQICLYQYLLKSYIFFYGTACLLICSYVSL